MAWIESHQDLEKHPKTLDLMNLTGWDLDTCLGKLHRLWWWCTTYAEDGDLRRHNDMRIAAAMGVLTQTNSAFDRESKGGGVLTAEPSAGGPLTSLGVSPQDKAKRLVEAMVASCWIDREPYFRVHDWWTYHGKFLQSKYKREPDKWERVREMYRTGTAPPLVPGTAPPNTTQQNTTQQNLSLSWESGFDAFWSEYPRKEDRTSALGVWNKIRPDANLQAKILSAIKQHKLSAQWLREDGRFIPYPEKWLRRRRWEDETVQSEQFYSLEDIRRRNAERKQGK